jgi:SAM-dependent methyltransferase
MAENNQALYLPHPGPEYGITPHPAEQWPTPPPELMEYHETAEQHLSTGRANVDAMLESLGQSGFAWRKRKRVLEFGCSNGKLVRWLAPYAERREVWGTDVQAEKVLWAAQNLSPPLHFATNTTLPHLPFPDHHFDLVFAGSVFTHIGELHVAWLSELARILSSRGFLYITLHDETAVKVATEEARFEAFAKQIRESEFSERLLAGDFGFVSMAPYGDAMLSQVMMSSAYVEEITSPFLRLRGTFPRSYAGFQTGYVFTPAS